VCRFAGTLERRDVARVAGVRGRAPMLDVETVAAGGGAVLGVEGLRARVGPASAGADPGPACYGRGGPATVTDANLGLGRLDPAAFPHVFGPGGDGQVACQVAEALGIGEVMSPMYASVLSAWGIGQARMRVVKTAGLGREL